MVKRSPLLAGSVRESSLAGYDATAAERWRTFDITRLLFSNFATVPAELLPVFAEQYGITRYVNSEAQTRAFLSRVIALFGKKGTAWAMREALAAIGWPGAVIIETGPNSVGVKYDGVHKYDGQVQYGGGAWATFRVELPLGTNPVPTAETLALITSIINEYKPARCQLIDLTII